MRRFEDPDLADTIDRPHTGRPQPFQRAQPAAPAAAPPARKKPPLADDPRHWIKGCLWRAQTVEKIATLTAIPANVVLGHLQAMQERGDVAESDGVWVRVIA